MRKTVAVPAIALLFVTGCGAAAADPGSLPASDPTTAQPAAETEARNSEEQTCSKLLETNGEGPLYQAIYLLKIGDGTSLFEGSAETASTLNDELQGIARDAPQDMEAALVELASPMESTIQLADHPGSPWDVNIETWKNSVAELLTRCAPYESGTGNPASSATPAPVTADGAGAAHPGYPLVVEAASLDYRVAAWFTGRLAGDQVVALAPGLYAPYDPAVPDLQSYFTADRAVGDGTMKRIVFPGSGGAATWSGVHPGGQEPQ